MIIADFRFWIVPVTTTKCKINNANLAVFNEKRNEIIPAIKLF